MKTCIILFLSAFFISCSSKFIPVEKGRYRHFQKKSFHYLEINIEFLSNDSIKVSTNKGGYNRTCIGLLKQIKNNTYQVNCYDSRDSIPPTLSNLIQRFNIENDTLVYHKSYIKFWSVKLKRVPL
jgi:hypothetical protein